MYNISVIKIREELKMIEGLNFNELCSVCKWAKVVIGKSATLGDLQKYIIDNGITTKRRLLNKLFADYINSDEE
jgi:hypothetical protein